MKKTCAIITGASRGIGKATAKQLAQDGHNLIINYNKSKQLAEDLARELTNQYNIEAYACKANMANYEEIDNLVSFALTKFDAIDILVNNAGICNDMEFSDRTVGQFEKTFKTNLFGVFYISKVVGDHMFRNEQGYIINISSDNSINGFYPTTVDYDASKAALNSLTKNLAIQYSPYVNANAIAPGWVDTDMNEGILTPDIAELESQCILKKRIGTPEDISNLVAFLVSGKADYIDGEVIVINGGMF